MNLLIIIVCCVVFFAVVIALLGVLAKVIFKDTKPEVVERWTVAVITLAIFLGNLSAFMDGSLSFQTGLGIESKSILVVTLAGQFFVAYCFIFSFVVLGRFVQRRLTRSNRGSPDTRV